MREDRPSSEGSNATGMRNSPPLSASASRGTTE